MTTSHAQDLVKHLWKSSVVLGILAIVLGVLIWRWPGPTVLVAAIFFGAYLLVSGIAQIIFAFSLPGSSAGTRVLLFLTGVLSLILGVLCFRNELNSVLLLAIWIGIGWIAHGVAALITAISDPGLPGRGWQIFAGIVTAIAGIVIVVWPISSILTLAVVVGIWLIVIGVFQIISGFGVRSASQASV